MLMHSPPLPIDILYRISDLPPEVEDAILFALKQSDRVRRVELHGSGPSFVRLMSAMTTTFPALEELEVDSYQSLLEGMPFALPNSFLGGSAPRLHSVRLDHIVVPRPASWLLSPQPSALRRLRLQLPEGPEACISSRDISMYIRNMPSLEELSITLSDPSVHRGVSNQLSSLKGRTTLPRLRSLFFEGRSISLEELVRELDTPQLTQVSITLSDQYAFHNPLILEVIGQLKPLEHPEAEVYFYPYDNAIIDIFVRRDVVTYFSALCVDNPYTSPAEQVYVLSRLCSQISDWLSTVWRLLILWDFPMPSTESLTDSDRPQWHRLFRALNSVETLEVNDNSSLLQDIFRALQPDAGSVSTELLPNLEELVLYKLESGTHARGVPISSAFDEFLATRELAGRPVNVLFSRRPSTLDLESQIDPNIDTILYPWSSP
ncbi:hypothetical protein BC834DRAFT_861153 [Gloeopeniophorella convolvens]|nr:hypothetical protein BC834DRAFT_861153 [Gloeopeniophorella convolvens]